MHGRIFNLHMCPRRSRSAPIDDEGGSAGKLSRLGPEMRAKCNRFGGRAAQGGGGRAPGLRGARRLRSGGGRTRIGRHRVPGRTNGRRGRAGGGRSGRGRAGGGRSGRGRAGGGRSGRGRAGGGRSGRGRAGGGGRHRERISAGGRGPRGGHGGCRRRSRLHLEVQHSQTHEGHHQSHRRAANPPPHLRHWCWAVEQAGLLAG
jgi:hypothetical protein